MIPNCGSPGRANDRETPQSADPQLWTVPGQMSRDRSRQAGVVVFLIREGREALEAEHVDECCG